MVKFKLNHTKISIWESAKPRDYDLMAKFIKEIHELPDLTMPFDHPVQVCQGTCKFAVKDEE